MFALGDLSRQMMIGDPFEANTSIAVSMIKNLDVLETLTIEDFASLSHTSVSSVKRFLREQKFGNSSAFFDKIKSEYILKNVRAYSETFSFDIAERYDLDLLTPLRVFDDIASDISRADAVFIFNDTINPVTFTMIETLLRKTPCYNFISLSSQEKMIKLMSRDSVALYYHSTASANKLYFREMMDKINAAGCRFAVISDRESEQHIEKCDHKIIFENNSTINFFLHYTLIDLKISQLLYDIRNGEKRGGEKKGSRQPHGFRRRFRGGADANR